MAGYKWRGDPNEAINAERKAIQEAEARIQALKTEAARLEKLRQQRTQLEAEEQRLRTLLAILPEPTKPKPTEWTGQYGGRAGLRAAVKEIDEYNRRKRQEGLAA